MDVCDTVDAYLAAVLRSDVVYFDCVKIVLKLY